MDPIWDPMWLAVRYLLDRAYCRARAALDGNPESGALTLEWLVIAGILVGAAARAASRARYHRAPWMITMITSMNTGTMIT